MQYVVLHMGKIYGPFADQPTADAFSVAFGGGGNIQPLWPSTNIMPDPKPRY